MKTVRDVVPDAFVDWYMAKDHGGVDSDLLEDAFVAGLDGRPAPAIALGATKRDRIEVKAAFRAGAAAAHPNALRGTTPGATESPAPSGASLAGGGEVRGRAPTAKGRAATTERTIRADGEAAAGGVRSPADPVVNRGRNGGARSP